MVLLLDADCMLAVMHVTICMPNMSRSLSKVLTANRVSGRV